MVLRDNVGSSCDLAKLGRRTQFISRAGIAVPVINGRLFDFDWDLLRQSISVGIYFVEALEGELQEGMR